MADRIQFENPKTGEVYKGVVTKGPYFSSSIYGQPVYRIELDNGEKFDLSDYEIQLYRVRLAN